jgi:hypothetical protein
MSRASLGSLLLCSAITRTIENERLADEQTTITILGLRSVQWVQNRRQRLSTLLAVGAVGFPELSAKPRDVLNEFRRRYGFKPSQDDFLEWYRKNMSKDYAAVFR